MSEILKRSTFVKLSIISAAVLFGIVIIIAATVIFIGLPQFHAVHGTSMTPEYQPGDLVIAVRDSSVDPPQVGDVIVFNTHDPEFQGLRAMHRVVGSYVEPTDTARHSLITKGDNNAIAEPLLDYPIYDKDVVGKVVFKIPWIALPKIWMDSSNYNTTDTLPTQQQMEEAFKRR